MGKQFYFNADDESYEPDPDGTELGSLHEARRETIKLVSELLVNGKGDALLTGGSLRVWVTDKPKGDGQTLFGLRVSTLDGDPE